jgi:sugar O-acyltransferase (sialic acid O-acetyltransferase NeuD family)
MGRMVEQIVFDINAVHPRWEMRGFIDDDDGKIGETVAGFKVLGGIAALNNYPDVSVALGFSNPRQKKEAMDRLLAAGYNRLATLVHPRAWVSRRVQIGDGSIVYPGVHIDVDVRVGKCVLLNKLCTVGHDTSLGDFTTAAPGANLGGNCTFGDGVEFGINSSTIQGIQIGDWSVIGGGAVVIRDIPRNSVAVGVPAKVIRQR